MPYQLTTTAQGDFDGIVRDAARKSKSRALRVLSDFSDVFDSLEQFPGMGEAWRGYPPGLRFKRVKPGWLVFYEDVPTGQTVTVIRIRWATSDLEEALLEM
jgi:plasmid stabilization system protein ParE